MSEPQFYQVCTTADLPPGERLFVQIDDLAIVIFNIDGQFYAIGDVCSHDDGKLGDGALDGGQIVCPRHGARFDLRTGRALTLPAVIDIPTFPVRVNGDAVEVGVG